MTILSFTAGTCTIHGSFAALENTHHEPHEARLVIDLARVGAWCYQIDSSELHLATDMGPIVIKDGNNGEIGDALDLALWDRLRQTTDT